MKKINIKNIKNNPNIILVIIFALFALFALTKLADITRTTRNPSYTEFKRQIENNEIKIRVLPLLILFVPIRVLNSLCNVYIIVFHKIKCRVGINQNLIGINIIPINVLIQLNDKFKILVDGSKTENKFVIIFRLNF